MTKALTTVQSAPSADVDTLSMSVLLNMLSIRRPSGTRSEKRFVKEFVAPLGTEVDKFGNHFLRIGDAPVLWSSHTDSVHNIGGYQRLERVGPMKVGIHKASDSNCLGADDAAGVWLMREMIVAKVPGLYVFHRSEEIGCKGSRWIHEKNPKLLEGIKFAVAFDRKGTDEVITHQGNRTCSDEFAKSMAEQLGMGYAPSNRGTCTDTKVYEDKIGECSNISVGYMSQHTKSETLDFGFLFALRAKLLTIDPAKFVEKRKPGEKERYVPYTYHGHQGDFYGHDEWNGWMYGNSGRRQYNGNNHGRYHGVSQNYNGNTVGKGSAQVTTYNQRSSFSFARLIREHPDEVASFLQEQGHDVTELETYIQHQLGWVSYGGF